MEIADIERNLQALAADEDLALEDKQRVAQQLAEKLNLAKAGLYDFYRSARSDSLVYRNLLSVNASPPTVSQLRRQLVGENGLLLIYQLGQHGGYLLSIDAESAHLHALAFTAAQAAALEVEAGPLSAARVRDALIGAEGKGLLTQLKRPDTALAATERLSALYQALIPTELSEQLLAGKFGRLMVVPDGQLALLPFGTLVVDSADRAERRYLLDVGPPIHYGPSATVLYNLLARRTSPARGERVLTLGNPSYPQRGVPAESLLALNIGARYGSVGGNLKPLPHSGVESRWVQQYFVDLGMPVSQLLAERATEAKLREAVAGRHTIHLACHGLADQAYGNFFGALALSPGPEAETRPADDGFLTLGEIYGLDLSSCGLAVLSACDNN